MEIGRNQWLLDIDIASLYRQIVQSVNNKIGIGVQAFLPEACLHHSLQRYGCKKALIR